MRMKLRTQPGRDRPGNAKSLSAEPIGRRLAKGLSVAASVVSIIRRRVVSAVGCPLSTHQG